MSSTKLSLFPNNKLLLPVIHVQTLEQAEKNIILCQEAGADGVFLINHAIKANKLIEISSNLKWKYPKYWMGINCLGNIDFEDLWTLTTLDGVWTDQAFDLNEDMRSCSIRMKTLTSKNRDKTCVYFGGVAFKYQPEVEDLEKTCKYAAEFVDVITTSGPGTGEPPTVEKIKNMKQYVGDKSLAIASGITIDNVSDFLPYVDCFLVSTGISSGDWDNLDPVKTKELAEKIHV